MTTLTTEPAFYDAAMTDSHEPAMLDYESSPWRTLYEAAQEWIPASKPVVDLGCGTGRFAECLRRKGHGRYFGIDFSPAAIAECERYVPEHDRDTAWEREFFVRDLREWEPGETWGDTIFTCLETLEHLEDDLDLVRRIPVGREFIFSVPNFGGEAHLRVFQDPGDAWRRYDGYLLFRAWQLIGAGPQNYIHLYRTVRRGDAW